MTPGSEKKQKTVPWKAQRRPLVETLLPMWGAQLFRPKLGLYSYCEVAGNVVITGILFPHISYNKGYVSYMSFVFRAIAVAHFPHKSLVPGTHVQTASEISGTNPMNGCAGTGRLRWSRCTTRHWVRLLGSATQIEPCSAAGAGALHVAGLSEETAGPSRFIFTLSIGIFNNLYIYIYTIYIYILYR